MTPINQRGTRLTPAEDRAYRSGRAAFKKGKKRSDNPGHCATPQASDKYWAWFRGFDEAEAEANE